MGKQFHGNDIPIWRTLIDFLEHRCHILEAIDQREQMTLTTYDIVAS